MSNPEIRIPEDIAPEVLELASRYYAEQEKSYSDSELVEAATEAGIPARFIEKAKTSDRLPPKTTKNWCSFPSCDRTWEYLDLQFSL